MTTSRTTAAGVVLVALVAGCSPQQPARPAGSQPPTSGGDSAGVSDAIDAAADIAAYSLQPGERLDVIEAFDPDGKRLLRREVLRDADGLVNHGLFERWHANGVLAEQGWYLKGAKHGAYITVAESGLQESETHFRRGVQEGLAIAWGPGGNVRERAHYVDGRLDGPFESFAGTDPLASGRYVCGLEEGPWTYWYPGGGKREEGGYSAGQREGVWRAWHANGTLQGESTYREGLLDGPSVEYDEEGRKLAERSHAGGAPHGPQVEYHPDGTRQSEAHYVDGRPEGLQRRWYPDGRPQMEGQMRDGKREGRWTYHNPDGSVNEAWSGTYRDDVRISG